MLFRSSGEGPNYEYSISYDSSSHSNSFFSGKYVYDPLLDDWTEILNPVSIYRVAVAKLPPKYVLPDIQNEDTGKVLGVVEGLDGTAEYGLSTISHYAPDVLIAPLQNIPFNKAKSNLKGLEASAVGAAFVASVFPGSPYSDITPQLTAVTKNTTPDDIMNMFDALRDPVLRKACVRTTRHIVAQRGWVAEMKQGTDKFIHTLFKGFLE